MTPFLNTIDAGGHGATGTPGSQLLRYLKGDEPHETCAMVPPSDYEPEFFMFSFWSDSQKGKEIL